MYDELFNFLNDYCNFAKKYSYSLEYFAIVTPESNYFTTLKIESSKVADLSRNIEDFIAKHIGKVENYENLEDKFYFHVDGKLYVLFNFTDGVVKI